MQWIVLLCGITLLLLLVWPRNTAVSSRHAPPETDDLTDALISAARREGACGSIRLHIGRRFLRNVERNLRILNRIPADELLPSSRRLCQHSRFLQEEAARSIRLCNRLPRLPRGSSHQARVSHFARILIRCTAASPNQETVFSGLKIWQEQLPMTVDELNALPDLLQIVLMQELSDLLLKCAADQKAQRAAFRFHHLLARNQFRKAARLARSYESNPCFWETLFRLDQSAEALAEAGLSMPSEDAVPEAHDLQALHVLWIENAIESLQNVRKMPWPALLEGASPLHEIMSIDPVYLHMDDESRAFYRTQVSRIARRYRRSERAVCTAAADLCRQPSAKAVETHIGYYLVDDGLTALLERLGAFGRGSRLLHLLHSKRDLLYRCCFWAAFLALLGAGFFMGYAIVMLIPFALLFAEASRRFCLCLQRRRIHPHQIPRIALDQLAPETQTLILCHAVLKDASHAIAMVKHLSVMHQANPDPHLHFLLLGDFQDSLTAASSTDGEIIAAASTALEALKEDTQHPFFYLQRERFSSPGERTFHGRERRRGAVETVLSLTQGLPVKDHFSFASIVPSSLQGQYRYVVVLDSDTMLPPGSIYRMVGAMIHPLQQRQEWRGKQHGISVLKPISQTAAHLKQTIYSHWLEGAHENTLLLGESTCFAGEGVIDPEPFLKAIHDGIPGGLLDTTPVQGDLAGCKTDPELKVFKGDHLTLKDAMHALQIRTRAVWQQLVFLIPLPGSLPRRKIRTSLSCIRKHLLASLIPLLSLTVMLYAAASGRDALLLAAFLLPEGARIFSARSFRYAMLRLSLLPIWAYTQCEAIFRTVYDLLFRRQRLLDKHVSFKHWADFFQPSMLYFGLNMGFAGLFALFPLLFETSWSGLLPAAVWASVPFWLPFAEQENPPRRLPNDRMREQLLHIARQTFECFDKLVPQRGHALPSDALQLDPDTGLSRRASPSGIGLYLCSLLAAGKLGLAAPDEMAERMEKTIHSLEGLTKWHGLPYAQYDTQTLMPLSPQLVSSTECGILVTCLLACAQGVRQWLPFLDEKYHQLSQRLDQLCDAMELNRLYDAKAGLFYACVNPHKNLPNASHLHLLADESRLLSFAAIMLRQLPLSHWAHLEKTLSHSGILLSQSGDLSAYLAPLLFHSCVPHTLIYSTCHKVVDAQRKHRLNGAYGISASACFAFDPSMQYLTRPLGLPELALETDVQSNVLAPYAAILCLLLDPARSLHNVQRLQQMELEGPWGFWESADFSPDRTGGKIPSAVRSYSARHQGMILCAICNVLCRDHIAHLFMSLPRAQAYRMLLEEAPLRQRRLIRQPVIRQQKELLQTPSIFSRPAQALRLPVDAHLLCGGNTTLLIDAQGGGFLKRNGILLTRFHQDCHIPSGPRLYLRDSQSGAFWTATDPMLSKSTRFETAQAVFGTERLQIRSELRIWINPLDGACIHYLTVENHSGVTRQLEVCSFLEPVPDASGRSRTERMDGYGAFIQNTSDWPKAYKLCHMLSTETPIDVFRIQTNRSAFLGRGRSFLSPQALAFAIDSVVDSLGDMSDPCLSLRAAFKLPAHEKTVFCLITQLAEDSDAEAQLYERYRYPHSILHTYDSALAHSAAMARYLHLSAGAQEDVSKLTGSMAYRGALISHPMDCTPPPSDKRPSLPISTAAPILLYTCRDLLNETLLKLLIDAQQWWLFNGFASELVVLIEDSARSSALRSAAETLMDGYRCHGQLNGIHLLSHLSQAEVCALHSMARQIFAAEHGTFEQQMANQTFSVRARPIYQSRSKVSWKHRLPPSDQLMLTNSFGGFSTETGGYQFTLAPGRWTPAPWRNLLCGSHLMTMASESGIQATQLHNASVHPCANPGGVLLAEQEQFFLRDEMNHLLWSLTRQPLGRGLTIRITHSPGETRWEASGFGIRSCVHCLPSSSHPAGLRIIHLQNDDQSERTLTLFHLCRFGSTDGQSLNAVCEKDRVVCRIPSAGGWAGLCAVEPSPQGVYTMPFAVFQGLWGAAPFALSCMEAFPVISGDAALLAFRIHLKPGESCTLSTAIVFGQSQESICLVLDPLRRSTGEWIRAARSHWEERIRVLQFDLPDEAMNLFLGRWIPYQTQIACLWTPPGSSRNSASLMVQQKLCSALALLMTQSDVARNLLMQCTVEAEQCSFSAEITLALSYTSAVYAEVTGDRGILDKPFSSKSDCSLLDHWLDLSGHIPSGVHGLPLEERSDTESVVLGLLLCETLRRLATYCSEERKQRMLAQRQTLLGNVEQFAWDGGWYLDSWHTDGSRKLAVLPQCMAVLCGLSRERCEIAMENAWHSWRNPHAIRSTIDACLMIAALHQLGQEDRAWALALETLSAAYAAPAQGGEPYLLPAIVPPAPVSGWRSDCAALFWKVVTEQLLGLRKKGDELTFRPVVPKTWDALRITYRFGTSTYHLRAARDCVQPSADGQPLAGGVIRLIDDGRIHEALFPLRT